MCSPRSRSWCSQVEFGSIFRCSQLDRRLTHTLNRLRRQSEVTRDFSGVALLEAHPFLSEPDLLAQGPALPCRQRAPRSRTLSCVPSALPAAPCTPPPTPCTRLPPSSVPVPPGVLVCLGGPRTYAGHHHAALIAADGDYIVEHVSAQALRFPLVPDDLSPPAFATYERLIASRRAAAEQAAAALALTSEEPDVVEVELVEAEEAEDVQWLEVEMVEVVEAIEHEVVVDEGGRSEGGAKRRRKRGTRIPRKDTH